MIAIQYIEGTLADLRMFRDLDSLARAHNAIDMALTLELVTRMEADSAIRRLPTRQEVWMEQKARKVGRPVGART